MHLTMLGCKVISREMYKLCATSKNCVEIRWMKAALHTLPGTLRPALQAAIDAIEDEEDSKCEAILLGYGLCSMGTVGLRTRRLPLVVPRAHDCITLLLGSRERYRSLFEEHNGGVYWYSSGWIEQFDVPGKQYDEQAKYTEYVLKYGEDNAQFLIETEKGWTQNYDCAAYIEWKGLESAALLAESEAISKRDSLSFMRVDGGDSILRKLVEGEWDDDFVIVRPGEELAYSSGEEIVVAKPREWIAD